MNEGHAGFLGLERIRELSPTRGLDFDAALAAVRAGTVFTTHTPVPAGIDRFPVDMVRHYFGGSDARSESALLPGVPLDRVLALGAEDDPTMFNMAHMGLRLAQRANGVSQLHGAGRRGMFGELWPGFDADEVPIGSVTNGVHGPTWAAREWHRRWLGELPAATTWLAERAGRGSGCSRSTRAPVVIRVAAARAAGRRGARAGCARSWLQRGASDAELGWTDNGLRSRRADHRLRPPGADLQAADADAARPGPAASSCCSTRSGRCSSSSPASRTRPTTAARR